jgi:hypothetical protein
MFRGELIHEVDRRVAKEWAFRFLRGAPFSRLRLSWKEQHCATLNPYRSVDCPYPERDCVLAFWLGVERTISEADSAQHAMGYFRMVVKRMALDRAENKPLAREGSRNPTPVPAGPGEGPVVPGTDARFERLGDILSRAITTGPRPGEIREDGETCPQ